jgi:ABC-type siderophore export system fused ATPase/permease subunit
LYSNSYCLSAHVSCGKSSPFQGYVSVSPVVVCITMVECTQVTTHTHTHTHTYTQTHTQTHTQTQTHTYTHTQTHRHTHRHTHKHRHTHTKTHTNTHTDTHTHTQTHIHTDTHTHTHQKLHYSKHDIQTCGKPPICFDLFRPSSWRYSKKGTYVYMYINVYCATAV